MAAATGSGTEYRFSPQGTYSANYEFKYMKLLSSSFGGCVDMPVNTVIGYFYYDEASNTWEGKTFYQSGGIVATC